MYYMIIGSIFILLSFFLGAFVKKKEIENKYIKPTLCLAVKVNNKTGERAAVTLYYDKEYYEYEASIFNKKVAEDCDSANKENAA